LAFAIFGGCLACTTRRMRDMPLIGIYCDQLTEFVRCSPAEYLLKLPGCLRKHSENLVKFFL